MNTLVLSGGALNGFSTLGAVQFLLDNKIIETKNIRKYIGTSSGSMISYLLAIGYTPVEIFIFLCQNKLFKNVKQFDFLSLVKGTGYVNFKDIHNILEVLTMKKIDYICHIMQNMENQIPIILLKIIIMVVIMQIVYFMTLHHSFHGII